jgi:spoIIIJ-associated protein
MISDIAREFLAHMGFLEVDLSEKNEDSGRIVLSIQTQNGRELIGDKGETLQHLQHLLKRIVTRRLGRPITLDVDVNNFRKIREDMLRDFALSVRGKVITNKKTVELDPMSSFDRRIIHMALADFSDVATESLGEGYARYIVVRPKI